MKKNNELGPFAKFEAGKIDMLFDMIGLEKINRLPNSWTYQPHIGLITSKGQSFEALTLCKHKVGDLVQVEDPTYLVAISEINLIRLADVTEDMAIRSGVEEVKKGMWKHYSPEMFFPKAMIKKIAPNGFGYSTAKGSFFSKWCKEQNDMMEIYSNHWIWQYVCKETETVVLMIDGKEGASFPFTDLQDMSAIIFDILLERNEERPVIVSSKAFGEVVWDYQLAHYCYADGRITESEFVRILFLNEDAETVLNEREVAI